MNKRNDVPHFLGAIVTDDFAATAAEPPIEALRAVRQRRLSGRLARAAAMTAAIVSAAIPLWRLSTRTIPDTPAPPAWIVHSAPLPAHELVVTQVDSVIVVHSPAETPRGLVVRTRAGGFSPLTDEALLAMLADRAPVLIGQPGARHVVFAADWDPR